VKGIALNRGDQVSCGCARTERAISNGKASRRHGESHHHRTPEYRAWRAMLNRCRNPRCPQWADYGGRGIRVCDAWAASYEKFLADVGRRPSPALSIDRIDGNSHYEPGNVRWATDTEQIRNRRNTIRVRWEGEELPLIDLCERLGVPYTRAISRHMRGLPIEKVMSPERGHRWRRIA